MEKIKKYVVLFLAGVSLSLVGGTKVEAVPALGVEQTYIQPDGTEIKATQNGDEFFNYVTGGEGDVYTKKADHYWYYKTPEANARSVGAKVGIDPRPANTLKESDVLKEKEDSSEQSIMEHSVIEQNPTKWDQKQNLLVFLVEFNDMKLITTEEQWQEIIFGKEGKTVRNYYLDQTKNRIDITPAEGKEPIRNGVLKLSLDRNHPDKRPEGTGNDRRAIVPEALKKASEFIDYSAYDKNGNNKIDTNELHIMFIVAGYEESNGNYGKSVWGHKSTGYLTSIGGKAFYDYTMFGERMKFYDYSDHPSTIGVICHEFGHDIGFPDLYNTDNKIDERGKLVSDGEGLGPTSLMASGAWGYSRKASGGSLVNRAGTTPVGLDAYLKMNLGFSFESLDVNKFYERTVKSSSLGESTILKIQSKNQNEYFLIENRQIIGYDEGMTRFGEREEARGGIAVYRINTNFYSNRGIDRQLVTILEADESFLGYSNYRSNKVYDTRPFYTLGKGVESKVTSETVPSTKLADGSFLGTEIKVLTDSSDEMKVAIGIPVVLTGISLDKKEIAIERDQTAQLTATVVPENATNKKLIWSSSDEKIAAVNQQGLITAKGIGETIITVTNDDKTVSEKCKVTVSEKNIEVDKISLQPSEFSIIEGESKSLSLEISPSNATNKKVIWKSKDETIAMVNNDGKVTGKKAGVTEIIVTTENGKKTSISKVIVKKKANSVSEISLNTKNVFLEKKGKYKLIPTIKPKEASNKNINWTSSDSAVAKVSIDGTIEALKRGKTIITATTEDGNKKATTEVVVDDHGRTYETATTIGLETIEGNLIDQKDHDYFKFTAPEEGIYIFSSKSSIHIQGAMHKAPNYYPLGDGDIHDHNTTGQFKIEWKFNKGETLYLSVISCENSFGDYQVNVKTKDIVKKIEISPEKIYLEKNQSRKLTATITPDTVSNKKVNWISSNNDIARVGADGKVDAVNTGEVIVTATTEDGSHKATAKVVVDDHGNTYETATIIGLETVGGNILDRKDHDYFKFKALEAGVYVFSSESEIHIQGAMHRAPGYYPLGDGDIHDHNTSGQFKIEWKFDKGETLYLSVIPCEKNFDIGSYKLSVKKK